MLAPATMKCLSGKLTVVTLLTAGTLADPEMLETNTALVVTPAEVSQ